MRFLRPLQAGSISKLSDGNRSIIVLHYTITARISAEIKENHRPIRDWFLYTASPQQGDIRLSGPPSGQDADSGARTRDRRVPAALRADSLATVSPTPLTDQGKERKEITLTTRALN
ncbi:hypothetical protein PoB_000594300 [Plakobranchus ocellatus]|uniref:Uncharacterized protein n=1 Tax=Plakobranchus ocellatus TaxID=259542 RepID=A0AAV3YAE7_9GAST|nr:hypothetical protein PoB_000594300 [Plakobranchus ocellatus]